MNNVEHFKKIATELGELYDKKNKAYGNSFSDTYKKLGIISAVTRISDKFNRLCNIATNPDIDNLGESLEDTLRDMASYCIMTVMELKCSPEDLKIRKGDRFECIKTVIMNDGEVAYQKGYAYISEMEDCITDKTGCIEHRWNGKLEWQTYFKRI